VNRWDFIRNLCMTQRPNGEYGKKIPCPAGCGAEVLNYKMPLDQHFNVCPNVKSTCSCCTPKLILRSKDTLCVKKVTHLGSANYSGDAREEIERIVDRIDILKTRLTAFHDKYTNRQNRVLFDQASDKAE
jgi:hypothetical protein